MYLNQTSFILFFLFPFFFFFFSSSSSSSSFLLFMKECHFHRFASVLLMFWLCFQDKMSQNQTPFVVATSNPPHNISPTVGHSPVTSPAANRSAIIITAHIDSHKQQGMSPAVASGHRRAGSDATHRRQQFAESPQGSVHDQVYGGGSHTSPVRADIR